MANIPWTAPEEMSYVLVNKDGDQLGTGVLSVGESAGKPGALDLSANYKSETSTDESTVTVDAQTLKPISARRHIVTKDDDQTVEVEYTEEGALIKQGDKQSGLSVPEHSYDNDSSLFLWRTIDFSEDYRSAYTTIIANRRDKQKVALHVTGKESITVPAGQFEAWRLEIRTSNARQLAWFTDTPQHALLRYDNDRGVIFELQALP